MMQATNLVADAPSAGAAMEIQSSKTAQALDGQSGEFQSLVQALIQGKPDDTKVEGDGAGQQAEVSEAKKSDNQPTTDAQIAACLLGSSESVQQMQVMPVITEQLSDSAQKVVDAAPVEAQASAASPVVMANVPQSDTIPAEALPVEAQQTAALPEMKAQASVKPTESAATTAQGSANAGVQVEETTATPVETSVGQSVEAPVQDSDVKQPKTNETKTDRAEVKVEAKASEGPQMVEHSSTRHADAPTHSNSVAHQLGQVDKPQETPPGLEVREAVVSPQARATETLPSAQKTVDQGLVPQAEQPTTAPKPSSDSSAWSALTASSDAQRSHIGTAAALNQAAVQVNKPGAKQVDLTQVVVDSAMPKEEVVEIKVKAAENAGHISDQSNNQNAGLQAAGSNSAVVGKSPVESVTSSAVQSGREVSAKVINQIVQSAKTHIFDGGAGMTLRLDPPHLGTVHMNVVSTGGTVTAVLQTTSEAAKQMLDADVASLREALANSGINIDSINVSVGGGSEQAWTSQGQQSQADNGSGRSNAPWGFGTEADHQGVPINIAVEARAAYSSGFDYLA
jgi:hypothetical protein